MHCLPTWSVQLYGKPVGVRDVYARAGRPWWQRVMCSVHQRQVFERSIELVYCMCCRLLQQRQRVGVHGVCCWLCSWLEWIIHLCSVCPRPVLVDDCTIVVYKLHRWTVLPWRFGCLHAVCCRTVHLCGVGRGVSAMRRGPVWVDGRTNPLYSVPHWEVQRRWSIKLLVLCSWAVQRGWRWLVYGLPARTVQFCRRGVV